MKLLRQRNFALLWVGGFISNVGDWAPAVTLPIFVYRLTGSTLATSIAVMAELVPSVTIGFFAGVFVDRWNRKWTVILCNLLLAAGLLPLVLVHSKTTIWIIYLVAAGQAVIVQFQAPAVSALIPMVVREDDLVSANSLIAMRRNLARLIGPALGGLAAATGSLTLVAFIDAGSFVVAAAMTALVFGSRFRAERVAAQAGETWRALLRDLVEGVETIRKNPLLATLVAAIVVPSLGEGLMSVMFVVWVRAVLHGGALQIGWFMSAQAVGGVLGSLAVARWGKSLPLGPTLGLAMILFGLLDTALFVYPLATTTVPPGLVLIALVGLPAAAIGATWTTLIQTLVPDALRGRVFGSVGSMQAISAFLGVLLAGFAGGVVSAIAMLAIFQGGVYALVGTLLLPRIRSIRTAEAAAARSDMSEGPAEPLLAEVANA